MSHGFSVKKPTNIRRSFAVTPYRRAEDGRKLYERPVNDEALTALNKNLLRGIITVEQATLEIQKIILPRLKEQAGIKERESLEASLTEQNLKVYNKFWIEEYEGKALVAPETARYELTRALSFIEPLSISTSDRRALQRKLDAELAGTKHKRYGGRINQLLTYLGRGFTLHLKKPDVPQVHYISWAELQTVLEHIKNADIRALAVVLFCTGVRLGEAFMFKPRDLKPDGSIFISRQLDRNLQIREVKNRKAHTTLLLEEGREAFMHWAAIRDKDSFRKRVQHPIINAARKAFSDRERRISPHDLRHSYAIHLLGLGVPIDRVAKLLGDSVKTTEDYYAGFVMSSDEINFVKGIIAKAR